VYERVANGTVDIIATDHAPHTSDEKDTSIWEAPSGVPGVETAFPLLIADAANGGLSYERIRDLTATNPAAIFNLPQKGHIEAGYDADLVLFDTSRTTTVDASKLHTKCSWTPFEDTDAIFPQWTMIRGTIVYNDNEFTEQSPNNVRTTT
jgi:dihydroorotase